MSEIFFNYGKILNKSMQKVLRLVLDYVSKNGMPCGHKFIITFLTESDAVLMPKHLKDKYPKQMSIMLEHEIYSLDVDPSGFRVELSFSGEREVLFVPFDSLVEFSDPYAKFSIQFSIDGISSEIDDENISFKDDMNDKTLFSEIISKDLFIASAEDLEDSFLSEKEKEEEYLREKCNIICIDDLDELV